MRCCALLALVSVATIGSSTALVDASVRTTVTVEANAYDERTSGAGCSPDGCIPENTRDGDRSLDSRWSCMEDLEDENCKITYYFEEPQDIVRMRIAFHKGDENQRLLKVKLNGSTHSTIESSGETLGFQNFALNSDETEELTLEALGLDGDEWISINEVKNGAAVKHRYHVSYPCCEFNAFGVIYVRNPQLGIVITCVETR